MLTLDVTWRNDRIGLFSTALTSIMASMHQARVQAIRTCCEGNMKGILITCFIYANEHKNEWPPELGVLIPTGDLVPEMLSGPCVGVAGNEVGGAENDSNAQGTYFLYRRPGSIPNDANRGTVPVICEPRIHEGGAVVGFLDGHVEWVESPRAEEIIQFVRGK